MLKDDNNITLSETYKYYSPEDNNRVNEFKFVIIATKEMLNNLSSNIIEQFFMDCTYSTVPPSIYKFKLMVISGYNFNNNKTLLCAFILLMNEKKFTFDEIFTNLKTKFNFHPNIIICDFNCHK